MRTVKAMDYSVTISDSGKRDGMGKAICIYSLVSPDGDEIFNGADLHCSPMHDPESDDSIRALLGFLTLRPGDTDADYFDSYTPEQLAWAKSGDCEDLALWYAGEDGLPFD
jgi:hypothetical protein